MKSKRTYPQARLGGYMSDAGPPQVAKAPSGGSAAHAVASVGGYMSDAGPPQVARAPSGGSAAHAVASVGAYFLAAVVITGALSGCAPLILGGAAVGAMVTFDRRTSGAQLEDEAIELRGGSRLRDALGGRAHINITSYNRQVLLTGEVPDEQAKQTAEQIISRVDNVRGIANELAVLPNTTLTQRSADALVSAKIKASLIDDRNLSISAFKVVTERGTVYLMGRVTQREADRATQIARTISGVQRVVRIFEIISDEEMRRLVPGGGGAPPPSAAASSAPGLGPATPAPRP